MDIKPRFRQKIIRAIVVYKHVTASRRPRGRPRTSPAYDPSLPRNWTVSRLRTECERRNIDVPRHSRKAELVSAYLNASNTSQQLRNEIDASSSIRRRGFPSAASASTSTSREGNPGAAVDQSDDAHNGEPPINMAAHRRPRSYLAQL